MSGAVAGLTGVNDAPVPDDNRFVRRTALVMGAIFVAGFLLQWLMGRSSFAARPLVHVHALVAFGWVLLFMVQSRLGSGGNIALHRRIGWFAAGWGVLMVVVAFAITIDVVRRGITPFFFRPAHFLVANPLSVLGFAALLTAAIRLRRHTDWHWRLQLSATAILLGPAFGRLLPMPLLTPAAFETAGIVCLAVPLVGAMRDRRHLGHVHPAWWWGVGANIAAILLGALIGYSAIGLLIFDAVTAGSFGGTLDPMGFAPPPPAP